MKKIWMILLCSAVLLCAAGCGSGNETENETSQGEPASRDFFAMDTYMTVSAYGEGAEEALEQAEQEVYRLDELLAAGNGKGEIARLNENGRGTLSEETGELVERSLQLYRETGGTFDIAIYPAMKAWGFTDENYRIPEKEELAKLRRLTDASQIDYDASKRAAVFRREGMQIDLGGIAKGYTSGRIMELYKAHGITSGLVSLGGNVQVLGTKPDGSKWNVAIQSPEGGEDFVGVLQAEDTAVITSGGYERNFEKEGKVYHHILDPKTGCPAESGLKSVTIVSSDGTLADALSTALFIMGKEEALKFWQEHSRQFDAILMTDENELYVTEGISQSFSSENYKTEIVKQ